MACDDIMAALSSFQACTETPHGSRLATHCLYPSFEPVDVYVHKFGDGFRVHDCGGARREAWLSGIDDAYVARLLNKEAARYQIEVEDGCLRATAQTADWLLAAVLAVANAAASVARIAADKAETVAQGELKARIDELLSSSFPGIVRRDYAFRGKSGKDHHFDFALKPSMDQSLLINAVFPHHASIYANYVMFADTKIEGYENIGRMVVFDKPLSEPDKILLEQVTSIVPVRSLPVGTARLLERHKVGSA
ncbi:hypothetical protein [Methylobacterium oryzihabitans]|uniref:DUF1828 domain-containing protein n=1 Tax=Methylobacterium oryzihabitans TaxID=2499852 RepID=A0A437NYP6_9HYPH|nr:hypothetical protein [Methylobacterium oryzihabitans]RVU15080.1 hypothetical protein EOE48_21000 [Methylobacterium oryzihabitans]